MVSADDAAGGEPATPSSLTPDKDPEGDLLCAGAGAACSESPDSCLDDMTDDAITDQTTQNSLFGIHSMVEESSLITLHHLQHKLSSLTLSFNYLNQCTVSALLPAILISFDAGRWSLALSGWQTLLATVLRIARDPRVSSLN